MNYSAKLWLTLTGSLFSGLLAAQSLPTELETLLHLGRFEEAAQRARQHVEKQPSLTTHFEAGYTYLRSGKPDSARIWFEKGQSMDEKRLPLNQLGLALTELVRGNQTIADPQLDEVVKKSKGKNAGILFRIGEAYTGYLTPGNGTIRPVYKSVNPAKAIDYLNRAAERDKKNASVQLALGDAYYLNKDAGTAVSRYESALELGMNPSRVYQRMGDIYWQGKNLNLAVENYKKAIEANPDYAPAYNQLAELYFLVNRYKEAARYMDQYVRVAQSVQPETRLRQAQFHFLAKDFQRAVNLIDSNQALIGSNPITYRIKGWAYSSLNNPSEAIKNISTFLEKAPEKVMSDDYKYLGRAYLTPDSTADEARKAVSDSLGIGYLLKAAPHDTTENLYSDVAKIYYRSKQHAQAVAVLDSAAKAGFKADMQDLFRYGMSNYTLGFQRDSTGKLVRDTLRFAKADSALALAQQGAPDYAPTVLYRAKANYYAFTPEEAVVNGRAKPYFEQFITMVADKEEERTRYQKDLVLALKYLISYHELVTKDESARNTWLQKGLQLFPDNPELAKIATPEGGQQGGQQ